MLLLCMLRIMQPAHHSMAWCNVLINVNVDLRLCRLLASKEAEQQDCMGREAAQVRSNLHFFGQKKGSRRQQANQDGPGNMRSGGPRYAIVT